MIGQMDRTTRPSWRRLWLGAVALGLGVVTAMPARAQGPPGDKPAAADLEEAARLNAEVERLYSRRKYDVALGLAERALAIREKALEPNHPDIIISLSNLGLVWHGRGDYARAETLYK